MIVLASPPTYCINLAGTVAAGAGASTHFWRLNDANALSAFVRLCNPPRKVVNVRSACAMTCATDRNFYITKLVDRFY